MKHFFVILLALLATPTFAQVLQIPSKPSPTPTVLSQEFICSDSGDASASEGVLLPNAPVVFMTNQDPNRCIVTLYDPENITVGQTHHLIMVDTAGGTIKIPVNEPVGGYQVRLDMFWTAQLVRLPDGWGISGNTFHQSEPDPEP